ncbi:MAG: ribosomal RNA small subunit methyltransferase A [Parcubacteria group bacterium]|nr:ribosomal RNA small subunit methyltransferase A [Parcubacteria group bacterium]
MQRLGQHFLINKAVLSRIVAAINPQPNETIIEVGPGHGELTEEIRKQNTESRLILIEKDEKLARDLKEKYLSDQNIEIITGDALKTIPSLIQDTRYKILDTPYKVVGNIPYYLTGFLLRTLLELEHPPKEIVFTIQKEVAERIVAKPPHMNLLAVSVQYFGTPELVFAIPKSDFNPPPKIDSATIRITPRSVPEPVEGQQSNKTFFTLIKAGFSHPRKLLINNLSEGLDIEKSILEKVFKKEKINLIARAQKLSLNQWHSLFLIIE